jgi:hypothetical protein
MAVVWERDDGDGWKTEVSVSPFNGGFVRAGHVGPRKGTTTVISGNPEKIRRLPPRAAASALPGREGRGDPGGRVNALGWWSLLVTVLVLAGYFRFVVKVGRRS